MSKLFPIMALSYNPREDIAEMRRSGVCEVIVGMPWDMIAPHEAQAKSNHGQTLARLAERGGLSPCEALAILKNESYGVTKFSKVEAMRELGSRVMAYRLTHAEG